MSFLVVDSGHPAFAAGELAEPRQASLARIDRVLEVPAARLRRLAGRLPIPSPLSKLRCAGRGRRLIGDACRHRRLDPVSRSCKAARRRTRGWSNRTSAYGGPADPAEAHEALAVKVLERVQLGAELIDEVPY